MEEQLWNIAEWIVKGLAGAVVKRAGDDVYSAARSAFAQTGQQKLLEDVVQGTASPAARQAAIKVVESALESDPPLRQKAESAYKSGLDRVQGPLDALVARRVVGESPQHRYWRQHQRCPVGRESTTATFHLPSGPVPNTVIKHPELMARCSHGHEWPVFESVPK